MSKGMGELSTHVGGMPSMTEWSNVLPIKELAYYFKPYCENGVILQGTIEHRYS